MEVARDHGNDGLPGDGIDGADAGQSAGTICRGQRAAADHDVGVNEGDGSRWDPKPVAGYVRGEVDRRGIVHRVGTGGKSDSDRCRSHLQRNRV